ncbi:MAG TPA: hypothetical protein ENF37_08285 [Beggiatoa sp.]|nr:hypothetical protein [Beggiatoa sp.]
MDTKQRIKEHTQDILWVLLEHQKVVFRNQNGHIKVPRKLSNMALLFALELEVAFNSELPYLDLRNNRENFFEFWNRNILLNIPKRFEENQLNLID